MSKPTQSEPIPTLSDVAKRAGVSTATVSRALNFPDQVVASTRARVMDAVNALGYSPNFGARALAAKRTNTIGAIIPTMDNAIFARGIQAFQEELSLHGMTLLIASSSYRQDREEAQIRTLTARGADALLLIGYDRDPAIYQFLHNRNLPFAIAWAYDPASPHPSVGFDNRSAMRALMQEVVALGHRRFGFISAETKGNDRARERVAAIRDVISERGFDARSVSVVETAYSIENGDAAFRILMQGGKPPTVVLCGNDVLAVGALRAARQMGLHVPNDVSITGFDDIELAGLADPPLTTVHVPHREMGTRAARTLIGIVKGTAGENTRTRLETTLCIRESLGPPRAQ